MGNGEPLQTHRDVQTYFRETAQPFMLAKLYGETPESRWGNIKVVVTDVDEESIGVYSDEYGEFRLKWDAKVNSYTKRDDEGVVTFMTTFAGIGTISDDAEIKQFTAYLERNTMQPGDLVVPKDQQVGEVYGRILQSVQYVHVNWSNGTSSVVPLSSLKRHHRLNAV